MSTKILDGKKLKEMLIGGAEVIRLNSSEINDLNVFPVPDGDTGTNMTKTFEGGVLEVSGEESESVATVMDRFAHGLLLGARGNSGVILSQIFAGIKEELSKYETVTALNLAEAYKCGIKKSYESVMNPTEGTILTVFRESVEYALSRIDEKSTIDDFYKYHIEEARRSLARTKAILPALAEADVVDSGAAGYLYISLGMYQALTGKLAATAYDKSAKNEEAAPNIDLFTRDSVLEYGYCTEFLLRLQTSKVDPDAFDVGEIVEILKSLGGESIVAYKTEDIVKVHVHTFTPGDVLTECQRFGEFITLKIENMSVSHNGAAEKSETPEKKTDKKKKLYATLAVASGEGICALFSEMGADGIISGGQTDNPSIEEFIAAFEKCSAENIIVLPNNKNVMLAANQAAQLYEGARVHIVPTATLMQGWSALQVITPGVTDVESLVKSATRAAEEVIGTEITRAVRNVTLNGVEIKCGDYISITSGEITSVAATAEEALLGALDACEKMDEREIITLFVGAAVDDDRRVEITERLEEKYPDCEVTVYIGGQEVYDYYVAVE